MKKIKIKIIAAVTLFILAGILLLFVGGVFNREPTIVLEDIKATATVLLDSKKVPVAKKGDLKIKTSLGKHTIIVSDNNAWPWVKSAILYKGENLNLKPIFLYKDSVTEVVDPLKAENKAMLNTLELQDIPSKDNAIMLSDNTSLYVDKNTVYFQKAGIAKPVFIAKENISGLAMYPQRDATFLIGLPSGIFAVALDTEEPRSFQPVITAKSPYFVVIDKTLYVRDAMRIIKMEL